MPDLTDFDMSMREVHHIPVPYGLSREELEVIAGDFIRFISLPPEVLQRFEAVALSPEDRGSHVGYRHRKREVGHDDKVYVHYHSEFERLFGDAIKDAGEVAERFVVSAKRVYDEAKKSLKIVVDTYKERHPEFEDRFLSDRSHYFLRFLAYLRGSQLLANGHYDRGGSTLAIAESVPGLRMGINELDLTEVVHRDRTALFFGGLGLKDYFPPTWHDVVDKGINYDDRIARWAMVFFADKDLKKGVTFEEAHTPLRYEE